MISIIGIFSAILGASLVVQGIMLRMVYRRQMARQQSEHQHFQQAMQGQFEQAKRQIDQLQRDLAAARLRLKQAGQSAVAGRHALERELDAANTRQQPMPLNGFADTQPSSPVTEYGSLLLSLS